MKAEARSLTFLANEGSVKIPFFQRAYVWKEDNWEDLLLDLLDFKRDHFLGSLILKQQESRTGDNKQVFVIDGQQRLTTLSILLKSLYDSFDEDLKKMCKEDGKYDVCLFYKKDIFQKELLVKIEHSKVDKQFYAQVIQGKILPSDIPSTGGKNNILRCYKYYSNRLLNVSQNDRMQLFSELLDNSRKILVVIDLEKNDDEQKIFDSINSSGVRLSSADIVKNALFQKAFDLFDQTEVEQLYEENWHNVFLLDEETISFWDSARSSGRLWRDNLEILLHSISIIHGFFDPDQNSLSDLAQVYKDYISNMDSKAFEEFLESLKIYSDIYRNKIPVFTPSDMFEFKDFESRLFHVLSVCDVSTFHPFILNVYRKFENDQLTIEKHFKNLESFVLYRTICNMDAKNFNKLCKSFINDPSKLEKSLYEISKSDVKLGLSKIKNKHATLVLFWVELYRRFIDKKYDKDSLKYTYTLEHIMPQKWDQFWGSVSIIDEQGKEITDPEISSDYRYKHIYDIGNMTLLKSSLNSSIKNTEFSRKISGNGRKKGIKSYAELGITKFDIIEPYEAGDLIWNEMKIRERSNNINKDVLAIWNLK